MRKTKIVATLGPATDDLETVKQLIQAGISVARMNFSHGSHQEHEERLALYRKACRECNVSLPVLLDTKGPEIRVGEIKGKIMLKTGQPFVISMDPVAGDEHGCSVTYQELYADVHPGDEILFDDGLIKLEVQAIEEKKIHCTICNDGVLSTKKSVNIPNVSIHLPPLTEKDVADLQFACDHDFDFVALSFVRKATDVIQAREFLDEHGGEDIAIIAKIENREGIDNIDEIIKAADGVMVARGDLGVEIPFEQVPLVQNELIKKTYKRGKVVITATQMLDSMIRNPRPTRAEVSDISTAIFEGTSAIMLSGETAMGKYPVESVQTMANVAERIEASIHYWKNYKRFVPENLPLNVTDSISYATCSTAMNLNAKAIVTVTSSGKTAKMISRFHPNCPIIAVTPNPKVQRQLQLSFGVIPVLSSQQSTTDELFFDAVNCALTSGVVSPGEMVVITAGIPIGMSGTTNLIKVQMAGDVAAHGLGIGSGVVSGRLCVVNPHDHPQEFFMDGDILVAKYTIHEMLPMMKNCKAVIVEDNDVKGHTAVTALALDIPVILGVDNATKLLKNGATVTLDIQNGTIQYSAF